MPHRMTMDTTKYPPGDFSFIDDLYQRALFLDAFTAITLTESWQLMRDGPGSDGYMFTNPEGMKKVEAAMKYMDSHSGGSYACVMRDMEFIANHGWNKYVADNIAALARKHTQAAEQSVIEAFEIAEAIAKAAARRQTVN